MPTTYIYVRCSHLDSAQSGLGLEAQELSARGYYNLAHERGMIVYGESLEGNRPTLGDDLDMRAYADIPMAALWSYGRAPRSAYTADDRGAASVAHLHGSTLVACARLPFSTAISTTSTAL